MGCYSNPSETKAKVIRTAFSVDGDSAPGEFAPIRQINVLTRGELRCRTLARAHARSSDPAVLAGYMGKSGAFDHALASFAIAYATRAQSDYDQFLKSKCGSPRNDEAIPAVHRPSPAEPSPEASSAPAQHGPARQLSRHRSPRQSGPARSLPPCVESLAEQERGLFWQVSGEIGLALIGADSEVLSQSPEQIAEVSAEPPEYLLLRSPDLGPRSSPAENS
jgi:hypothetical protein